VGSYNILRAVCASDADGKHVHRLRNTVCSERCPNAFGDPPDRLDWVGPTLLLAGNDLGIFTVSVGQKPELLGMTGPVPFSVDASGDRAASGTNDCSGCSGPVKIFSVPSGSVVGVVGGTKLANGEPSLSPDGTQVVFTRSSAKDSGPGPAIWTAAADGSHLQRLERRGNGPLWSPAGNRIAYLAPTGPARSAWRLVAAQGGASTTLLRNGPGTVFGWSPNGRWIAFPDSKRKLAVIDVATKKEIAAGNQGNEVRIASSQRRSNRRMTTMSAIVIAVGTGQSAGMDPELVAPCLPIADELTRTFRAAGVFGDELPVADVTDPQTRLLALVGRRV